MKSPTVSFHLWFRFLVFLLLSIQSFGLNADGTALLSFKYSVFSDPFSVLQTWNYRDQTPCSWTGISCSPPGLLHTYARVTGISLPNSKLTGSLFSDFSMIHHLRNLDLSNNSFNGSLPLSLFNVSELRFLDLSNNMISGDLPEKIVELRNLQVLNLSENVFAGKIPDNLTLMQNLSVVSLNNNYFSGLLPSGFNSVQVLDLSSNLINGSLPLDFGGNSLRYFNISYNKLSGEIVPEFAGKIPENATIDFSFNNFTGEIPENTLFSNQESKSFAGNNDLCGEVLNNPCTIPSSFSDPQPNSTSPSDSPRAIAAIPPKPTINSSNSQHTRKLRPVTIVAIVIGDLIGMVIFVAVFIYVCKLRKRMTNNNVHTKKTATIEVNVAKDDWSTSSSSETKGVTACSCLRKKTGNDDEESSDTTDSDSQGVQKEKKGEQNQRSKVGQQNKGGALVTVDGGEKELELETLLKASAFILGASGSSIMYKAVLEDGTVLAVRRIGESGLDRFKDFENQVRVIAKLVHPNLVSIRGFYWGVDEKLVIYDYVPNGSLANARYRKTGSSPSHHLPWECRLKIAKGVAKGLAYLHEKKHVHGNLKPSNILLGSDMEPKIGDFGLQRLVNNGESSYTTGASSRNFGSKRSTASRESFQDLPTGASPNPSPSPSLLSCASYYHAPESLRTLKPNAKWDVYAFGVLLLELLTGKVIDLEELGHGHGLVIEDNNRALKMTDVAIRADMDGKEDALLACYKLGISCVCLVPQKRPMMKEVVQILEKIASSPPQSQLYGHTNDMK